MRRRERESGVVLLVVLFFALLLFSSIATFTRRATVDAMIARNRDAVSRAEALARGGIRLATALLLEDRLQELNSGEQIDAYTDAWFEPAGIELPAPDGAVLRVRIEDSGAHLNLNALFAEGKVRDPNTEIFLHALFEKVIDEMPVPPGEKVYDVRELAANLIDYVDQDQDRLRGGPEDAYYQQQEPPYRAANRPLLSLEELRLVEGFDAKLVNALRPYLTVHPYAGGDGVNLNTAEPHVLALLFYNDGSGHRLAPEDTVRRILDVRAGGELICPKQDDDRGCVPVHSLIPNPIYPPATYSSNVFTLTAEAQVGDVRREFEAVIDRSQPMEPLLLSWRPR